MILFYNFFLSFPVVRWCQLPKSPSICRFPFLRAFWWLLDLVVRLLPSCVVFRFSLLAWRIFLCQIPSLYLDCIFLQFALVFGKKLDVVHVYEVVNFFLRFCNRLCISLGCGWVASWLSQIVMAIVRLPGICLFGSLLLLSFFFLLTIPLSRFAKTSR